MNASVRQRDGEALCIAGNGRYGASLAVLCGIRNGCEILNLTGLYEAGSGRMIMLMIRSGLTKLSPAHVTGLVLCGMHLHGRVTHEGESYAVAMIGGDALLSLRCGLGSKLEMHLVEMLVFILGREGIEKNEEGLCDTKTFLEEDHLSRVLSINEIIAVSLTVIALADIEFVA